jgi:hypothetical protein
MPARHFNPAISITWFQSHDSSHKNHRGIEGECGDEQRPDITHEAEQACVDGL